MYVIPFVNQKGGVGKSTLSLNLGAALAHFGMRVILIDLESSGDLDGRDAGPRRPTRHARPPRLCGRAKIQPFGSGDRRAGMGIPDRPVIVRGSTPA